MTKNEINILLVEDDEIDVIAVKRAFKKKHIANDLYVAKDGLMALDLLRGTNGHTKIPRPTIILLDINMPRMNGLEFLDEIRHDDKLRDSVVFVLTTSNAEEDICQAYKNNIAGYILKSNVGNGFQDAIAMLNLYWKLVEFPK